MKNYQNNQSEFTLEGRFLAFVVDAGKVKYLRIAVADNELQIKLSQQPRASLFSSAWESNSFPGLRPWESIQVFGEKKLDYHTGEFSLKAYQIVRKTEGGSLNDDELDRFLLGESKTENSLKVISNKPCVKILVCQKSGCQKKGGRRQHQGLIEVLRRGLQEYVLIEETGCLGKCSLAPNIVLMPGKQRLSGMNPDAIADLLETLNQTSNV